MSDHAFLFTQKDWLGEGTIQLSNVEDELKFYTRWNMDGADAGGEISAVQEVQIQGISDVMLNQFMLRSVTSNGFSLELENASLGLITGKGIVKDDLIAWEYRDPEMGFDGFEFYERQKDGSYILRAEYATPDQTRTIIQGRIWQKGEK